MLKIEFLTENIFFHLELRTNSFTIFIYLCIYIFRTRFSKRE